jgi:Domain of unknown function (DUF4157)
LLTRALLVSLTSTLSLADEEVPRTSEGVNDMRDFAPKLNQSQQSDIENLARSSVFTPAARKSLLHSQRTMENQAEQVSPHAGAEGSAVELNASATTRFAHDFSRVPVHSRAPVNIQAKLAVNTPGDIYEQEANSISEQVMRVSETRTQRACPCGGACAKCQTGHLNTEQKRLQTRHVGSNDSGRIAAPPIVDEVLRSPGQPLDMGTRAVMEPRFGYDFSRVRVHSGATAGQSAREMNAHAYTVGHNIVFGEGKLSPATHEGRRLLAHELTHVVQQSGAAWLGAGQSPGGMTASALSVQRAPGGPAPAPAPPDWLGSWRAGAVHVQGDIWDVKLPSLGGNSWVGPYAQLKAYIARQGFAGKMEAAHIVGGEHLGDIGSALPYEKAPCIAVDKSLHATWTKQTTDLQSQQGIMGGRATKTEGRPIVTSKDVINLYDTLYSAHPELKEIARKIVQLPGKDAGKGLTPKPKSAVPKPESPVDARQGATKTPAAPATPPAKTPAPPPPTPALPGAGQTPAVAPGKPGVKVGATPGAHVNAPKISLRGIGSSVASALLVLGMGVLLGRFADETAEGLVNDQVKKLQPEIEELVKKEVETVMAAGLTNLNPLPPYYIYIVLDVYRFGAYDGDLHVYDFGSPVVGIEHVFSSPLRLSEESTLSFERAGIGFMIEHNYHTTRIPLESLLEK